MPIDRKLIVIIVSIRLDKNPPFLGPWAKSDCISEHVGVEVSLRQTRPVVCPSSGERARARHFFLLRGSGASRYF
jgi:hypothetical protein